MSAMKAYLERFNERFPKGVGNTAISAQMRVELMQAMECIGRLNDKIQGLETKLNIRGIKKTVNRRCLKS